MNELRLVKRYRTAGLAGGLPAGAITFLLFRHYDTKFPIPGCLTRRNRVAASIVAGMVVSTFIYGTSWYYGVKIASKSLPDDSKLKQALWPDGVTKPEVEYPTPEEAAQSLGIRPELANADWRMRGVAVDQVKSSSNYKSWDSSKDK